MHSTVTKWFSCRLLLKENSKIKPMYHLSIIIITKAIKVFGITSAVYDVYTSLFSNMEINLSLLFYTLAIETFFIYMKSSPIEIPSWLETMEDLI